jgi:signal transduction histidine kinase
VSTLSHEDRLISGVFVRHSDTSFPRLVSLAAHDLRTPLATINGFAQTLARMGGLEPPNDRYVDMIVQASAQLAELLDELGLAARIEGDRYEPNLQSVDTLELARAAQENLGAERVTVAGDGGRVEVDVEAMRRGISALVQAALRHGGLERVDVKAEGQTIVIRPVTESSGVVVTGADLRDLGAAVAVQLVQALGGSVELDGDSVVVRLPT